MGGKREKQAANHANGDEAQQAQVEAGFRVEKQIIRTVLQTGAEKVGDNLKVSFLINEAGAPETHTYIIEGPGQDSLREALAGGIEIADLGDIPQAG